MRPVLSRVFAIVVCLVLSGAESGFSLEHADPPHDNPIDVGTVAWQPGRMLSWSDFRGTIPSDAYPAEAAVTTCGIGYRIVPDPRIRGRKKVEVFNAFYLTDSWVRPTAMHDNLLAHEQGHFDICELYTRIFRERIAANNLGQGTSSAKLQALYESVDAEYHQRQLAYEAETAHGTVLAAQQRWQEQIALELSHTTPFR